MNVDEAKKILELPEEYDLDLLKKNYKRLAIKYHPDKFSGDSNIFIKIKDSYNLLVNSLNGNSINFNIQQHHQEMDIESIFREIFNNIGNINNINIMHASLKPIRIIKVEPFTFNNFKLFNSSKNSSYSLNNDNPLLSKNEVIEISIKEYIQGFTIPFNKSSECKCEPIYCKKCMCLGYIGFNVCMECLGKGFYNDCGVCKNGTITKKGIIKFPPLISFNKKYTLPDKKIIKFKLNDLAKDYKLIEGDLYYYYYLNYKNSLNEIVFKDPLDNEHIIKITRDLKSDDAYLINLDNIKLYLVFKIN